MRQVITNILKVMPKPIYKVNIKATMLQLEPGEDVILNYEEGTIEGIRATATRLRPMRFTVNKTPGGILITRQS